MTNFVLSSSSTADMPLEYFKEKNIPFICLHFVLDGVDYPDDLGQSVPFSEFYDRIAKGSMPTTSQINIGEFIEFFEPFLKEGKDILHLSFSSGLSGTHNSALLAQEELGKKYPERKILIVDSLAASSGYGLLLDYAQELREQGKTMEEIYKWLEENKLKIHHWFFSSDLSHYKRGGRVSATSAALGNLLNICLLLNMDQAGKLVLRNKFRGKKRVIKEIVKMMENHAQGGLDYSGKCFISNSACQEDALEVARLIEEEFPRLNKPLVINSIGAVIGSHTGPGTVALFFLGDERQE